MNTTDIKHQIISLQSNSRGNFCISGMLMQIIFLISVVFSFYGFTAHDPEEENRNEIRSVLRAVTGAWEDSDTASFRRYYANGKEVRMIEGGRQNIGVDDLIQHHVLPHHEEFAELKINVKDTEVHLLNGYASAWAIQDFDVKIRTKDGKETRATGFETIVLQRLNGKWKIVHSHTSTRRVKSEEPDK